MTLSSKHLAAVVLAGVALLGSGNAQSLEDLNIQIHGYATQGFLYSTRNNFLTTNSSDGSAAWTEAVVNVSAVPVPKLRVAVQARYSLIGTVGNAVTLDYASAEYKVNDRLEVRFGKVKTPSGLLNEVQDIDPAYLWSLLPQSVYPILSRNSSLAEFGGVVHGTIPLGERLGKLEYSGWSGITELAADDGYFTVEHNNGIALPNGYSAGAEGAGLRWRTPIAGLIVGAYDQRNNAATAPATLGGGAFTGVDTIRVFNIPDYYARYERSRWMIAGEWSRVAPGIVFSFVHGPTIPVPIDTRVWYGMASYKVTEKLTAGVYDSQFFNRAAALGPSRFSKDWVLSGRYDFSEYVYLKAEQHFIDGTAIGYSTANNTGRLQPDTRLSILKIGVVF